MGFYDTLGTEGFSPPADDSAPSDEAIDERLNSFAARSGEEASFAPLAGLSDNSDEHADASTDPEVLNALDPGMTPAEEVGQVLNRGDLELAAEISDLLEDWGRRYKNAHEQEDAPMDAWLTEAMKHANQMKDRAERPPAAIGRMAFRRARGLMGMEQFLDNPLVADISINAHDNVWLEVGGQLQRVVSPLLSPRDTNMLIQRMQIGLPTVGKPIVDDSFYYPLEHSRRPGTEQIGVRVNITDGSIAADKETSISMRKPISSRYDILETWTDPVSYPDGSEMAPLPRQAADFLALAVRARCSILLIGGTGSGKTSLLKGLLKLVPDDERLMVIEDSHEIKLTNPNSKGLVATGNTDIAQLIEAGMRMRPDRIIVGECRKPAEVRAFLEAINTGHDGSITTTHASSARDGLYRLLTLASESSNEKQVGQLLAAGLHILVYMGVKKMDAVDDEPGYRIRRVMEIASIVEFSTSSGAATFTTQPIFGRFMRDAYGSTYNYDNIEIAQEMVGRGIHGIGARLMSHFNTQGVSREQLIEALHVDPDNDSDKVSS